MRNCGRRTRMSTFAWSLVSRESLWLLFKSNPVHQWWLTIHPISAVLLRCIWGLYLSHDSSPDTPLHCLQQEERGQFDLTSMKQILPPSLIFNKALCFEEYNPMSFFVCVRALCLGAAKEYGLLLPDSHWSHLWPQEKGWCPPHDRVFGWDPAEGKRSQPAHLQWFFCTIPLFYIHFRKIVILILAEQNWSRTLMNFPKFIVNILFQIDYRFHLSISGYLLLIVLPCVTW